MAPLGRSVDPKKGDCNALALLVVVRTRRLQVLWFGATWRESRTTKPNGLAARCHTIMLLSSCTLDQRVRPMFQV